MKGMICMKRIFSIFMILLMLLCSSSPAVFAADNTATVSVLEDIFTRSGSVHGANVQGNSFLGSSCLAFQCYKKHGVDFLSKAANFLSN